MGQELAPGVGYLFVAVAAIVFVAVSLPAARSRAQEPSAEQQIANAEHLAEGLQGVPGLILPQVPVGFKHNWYNYVLRFDMEALGHTHDARSFRDKIVDALNAEGVDNGVWQQFILPAMTVFQAQNGYGQGCPWTCPYAGEAVDYAPEQYPVAQVHNDTHACLVMALVGLPLGARARRGRSWGVVMAMLVFFAYYLMLGILVLYMTDAIRGGLGYSYGVAGEVYGTFIALVYLTPFFGGILGPVADFLYLGLTGHLDRHIHHATGQDGFSQ